MIKTRRIMGVCEYYKAINLAVAIASGVLAYFYGISIGGVSIGNADLFFAPLLFGALSLLPIYFAKIRRLFYKSSRSVLVEHHFAVGLIVFWMILWNAEFIPALAGSMIISSLATLKGFQYLQTLESRIGDNGVPVPHHRSAIVTTPEMSGKEISRHGHDD